MSAFRTIEWEEIIFNPFFTRSVEEMGLSERSINAFIRSNVTYLCEVIRCIELTGGRAPGTHIQAVGYSGVYDYVLGIGNKSRLEIKDALAIFGIALGIKIANYPTYYEARTQLAEARQTHFDRLDPLEKLAAEETKLYGLGWINAAMQLCREEPQYLDTLRAALPEGIMRKIFWGRRTENPARFKDLASEYGFRSIERPRQIEKEAVMAIRQKIGFDRTLAYALGSGR